ncbi:MAG: DNA-directed RNA polymerase subunit A' [Methanimicrococcus sp.]|nr:DNA-directed RNA polymerase subunit A' [Methanimicrococcus sp.]
MMSRRIQQIPKRISAIKFGLLSPKEIRNMSATNVITADTYDEDGFPIEMGLMDTRLGVIDPGLRCKTCHSKAGECPGHFGHIDLVVPVIHVGFNKTIRKLLRSVCGNCSRLLLSDPQKESYLAHLESIKDIGHMPDDLINEVYKEAAKVKKCPYCDAEQNEIKFEKPTEYIENGERLTPTEIRDRFENIPDEDIRVIGMDPENARPEWMILTVLPVPPVTVRPSITLESGQRSEDDLTHKLVDIIRINQRFQENRDAGAPQLIIEDLWELLQYHVTTFFDNSVSGIPPARHRSGRPLKTLSQRLKGKEGRFRGSLSGKRVNFSARTVISPDPDLSINEVGVPLPIALVLTIPEHVTERNVDFLKEHIRRGPVNYPGANYVIRSDGGRIKITDINQEDLCEKLEFGWIVERHLRDGDVVLFNRQPSLHKMSIMAHSVKVLDGKTFRMNPAVCPPYNADFDGDEMNMHVLQTEEARAEAKILLQVQENILSPRFGGPIIGGIHDHISGMFLLTRKDNPVTGRINKDDALDLLRKTDIRELPAPAGVDENGDEYWTGKQIFSQILPEGLNIAFSSNVGTKDKEEDLRTDAYVIIEDGELLAGTIDETAIGAFKAQILDTIIKEYGTTRGAQFVDDVTKLAIRAVMRTGLSFGISDEDIPKEAVDHIEEELTKAEKSVQELIEAYKNEELEPLPGRTLDETIEMRIMQELGRARDKSGKIADAHMGLENPAAMMARSGARGSILNITQMAACVGQQAVRGARINRGYRERTLSHFERGDLGADAHGFVKSSYKEGLNPTEYFFHSIGGREGLVDTAVRTSQSGYLQRRLVNALQDLEVQPDYTVRDTRGVIVQFMYGEDGIDPTKSDFSKPEAIHRIFRNVTGREV